MGTTLVQLPCYFKLREHSEYPSYCCFFAECHACLQTAAGCQQSPRDLTSLAPPRDATQLPPAPTGLPSRQTARRLRAGASPWRVWHHRCSPGGVLPTGDELCRPPIATWTLQVLGGLVALAKDAGSVVNGGRYLLIQQHCGSTSL